MKLQLFSTGKELPPQAHPLFADRASCGFSQPLQLTTSSRPDLHDYCIRHPERDLLPSPAVTVSSDGSLYNGDLLVVDCAEKPRHGDIVVASVQGVYGQTVAADATTDAAAHERRPGRRFIPTRTIWISLASSRTSSTARGRCTDVCHWPM